MSSPPTTGADADAAAIRRIIADVLKVAPDRVHPEADLVRDLGAESIDFLDLLFSLDALVGGRVLPERWGAWLKQRLPAGSAGHGITPLVIEEFVVFYRDSLSQPAAGEPS